MILDTVVEKKKGTHTRYLILLIIFIVTAVNYADRATLSIAGTEVAKELQLSAISMGYIFSAFGWAYLLMQIPGGWLLDKFEESVHLQFVLLVTVYLPAGLCGHVPAGLGGYFNVHHALYAGLLGSAVLSGECSYRGGLVPDERARYGIRNF